MKKVIIMTALGCLCAVSTAHHSRAADVTAAVDINSAYVWRGLTFNDGIVLQPSLDVTAGGFGLNVWGNLDVDDYDNTIDSGEFSEVDLTVSYGFSAGPVDLGIGYIEYLFPGGCEATSELFVTAGMDFESGFFGGVELYYDIDQVEDFYATASIGYAFDFNEQTSLELGGMISYAGEDFVLAYTGGTDGGFFNYSLSAAFSYAVTDGLSAGASVTYTESLDEDALPDESMDTNFFGGISIAYSF